MVLMTEQADRPPTPLSAPDQLFRRDSRGTRSEVDHGGGRRHMRRGGSPADLLLCLDSEADPSESKMKPAGMGLKPVEQLSPTPTPSDCETKFERKKVQYTHLSKTNAQFHKLFKEVRKDELLQQSYTCALLRDILYQGKMYMSDNWICFHSKVFGRDTQISIPAESVTFIKKTKTALLVPNALVIETTSDQHVFVSFLARNSTYKLLNSICGHLEVAKTCSSNVISSCENSFRVKCPTSLPLDLSADFSDLDGVVQQRRQEMMESSSSGSQTPDYDKITDFAGLPDTFLSAVKSAEVSVHADVHLQTPSQKHGAALNNGSTKLKDKSSQPVSLQAILLIYLFLVSVLVLSSCYMAFKIVALEHRLNSLVSIGQHIRNENAVSHRPQEEVNAEIYAELSSNLFKLEKIQRSLRKLLEET
ncbi:GRAM domain-containing protein 2B-like isoform X1 [Anarrhichthys ocellatus]|uniref:GRAM domain-containing protein 2B-like isoform X1 n=1 Tax=Anarrhichthys ocellatus TaxID=433405 RepID=UPI0012EDFF30|nr:GRAM domain-containing protein 2B-like isoform X1 [Anarrhichthys ocellatus]